MITALIIVILMIRHKKEKNVREFEEAILERQNLEEEWNRIPKEYKKIANAYDMANVKYEIARAKLK